MSGIFKTALAAALLALALPLHAQVVAECPGQLQTEGLNAESKAALAKGGFEMKSKDLPPSASTLPFVAVFLHRDGKRLRSTGITCLYGRVQPYFEVHKDFNEQTVAACAEPIPPGFTAGVLPGMPRNTVVATGFYCGGPGRNAAFCAVKCGGAKAPAK